MALKPLQPARGTGTGTRLSIGVQVLASVVLAAGVAALLTWLAGRPGLRARVDLSAGGSNTLDPVLEELIAKLPQPVDVELFFRPLPRPFTKLGAQIQGRVAELLFLARQEVPGRLRVVHHDLNKVELAAARMQELDLTEEQTIVVHSGDQRVVLRLLRDVARIDAGDPTSGVPPRLVSFHGEEALAEALLRVSQGASPMVRFGTGHGERDLYGSEGRDLGRLQTALEADGFDTAWWDPTKDPEVPEGTSVLVLVDPQQPYSPAELDAVRAFVARGGRLFAVPSRDPRVFDAPGSLAELLRGYGIQPQPGYVCRPLPNALGELVDGDPRCAVVLATPEGMDNRHPVTESLHRAGFRMFLPLSRAFSIDPQKAPAGGVLNPILRTTTQGWIDRPDAEGAQDWTYEPGREELASSFPLAVALTFPPPAAEPLAGDGPPERLSGRVLAFGSAEALSNEALSDPQIAPVRSFLLNAFNWLAERDWRLTVRSRERGRRVLDIASSGDAMRVVTGVAAVGLPGLCALLGAAIAFRRRR